jgi:hypothetical protein
MDQAHSRQVSDPSKPLMKRKKRYQSTGGQPPPPRFTHLLEFAAVFVLTIAGLHAWTTGDFTPALTILGVIGGPLVGNKIVHSFRGWKKRDRHPPDQE